MPSSQPKFRSLLGALIALALIAPNFAVADRDPACASLYRYFGVKPPPDEASLQRALGRSARIAAAEKAMPWNEEARLMQGEQLLEMRAQIARQGNFRDQELAEWADTLELRNRLKKILDPDPDGPDFIAGAKRYGTLPASDRLAWIQLFGRSEHPLAAPTLKKIFAEESSFKIRQTIAALAQDRGIALDSSLLARDLATLFRSGPQPAARGSLRSLNEPDLTKLLRDPTLSVRNQAVAGLRGRPRAYLEGFAVDKDPALRAAAADELKRRGPPPSVAEMRAASPEARVRAAAKINPEDPEHLSAFTLALQDPVAEVRLEALGRLEGSAELENIEFRRALRHLGQHDENIRVRRRAHDLLEPFSRETYATAPSRTWMLDAMRRKFPTHVKLPPERARDMELMLAASHVYDAPELEGTKTAADLLRQHRRFLGSIPADYEVTFLLTDPATGFKAAIYRPTSAARAGQPALVAIGGTQTAKDVLADLNWGVAQARSKAYEKLLARVGRELKDEARPIAITGHSLGGGLSQMLGHDLARALKKTGRTADLKRFRVVSWNGFGGKEALEKLGRFDAESAKDLPITSYFHPDDVVSKLGTHLGETIAIRARTGAPRGLNKLKDSHVIKAVQELFSMENALLSSAKAKPAKNSAALRWVEKFARASGGATDRLLQKETYAKASARVKLLDEARREWAKQEGYKELKSSYDWLKDELEEAVATAQSYGKPAPKITSDAELAAIMLPLRELSSGP